MYSRRPLLFLAYINDLPDSLKSSDARLFADDSLLYLTVNGDKDNTQLQEDLTNLEGWERVEADGFQCRQMLCHTHYLRQKKENLPVNL